MKNEAYRRVAVVFFGLIVLAQTLFLPSGVSALDSFIAKPNVPVEGFNSLPGESTLEESYGITRQVNPNFKQQAYLKADEVGSEDKFGRAAAIDGDTLVIGAPGEDTGGSNSGAAYVFVRSGAFWTQQAFLKASNAGDDDNFGSAVDIDGDTIVVGAYGEDSDGSGPEDNSALNAGAAYVFFRERGIWMQQDYLKADNAEAGDQFGKSVAIDGDRIVVGAQQEDGYAGAAYVFEREETNWLQKGYLKASNKDPNDYFGCSVAISGDTIVVGAEMERGNGLDPLDNSLPSAGSAYVFVPDKLGWTQQAYLKASTVGQSDNFGFSVSVSGDFVVVGAPNEDSSGSDAEDNSVAGAGAVYVFKRDETTWTQQAYIKASNVEMHDSFGQAVAIDGNNLVVSAIGEDSNGSSEENNEIGDSGAVYVFVIEGVNWIQEGYLKASNPGIEEGFGDTQTLDISGDSILVGAHNEDGDGSDPEDNSTPEAGAAYVFSKDNLIYLPLILR